MFNTLKHFIFRNVKADFPHLSKKLITVNNYTELMKLFDWEFEPILEQPGLYDFEYEEDLNERRIRDAEVIATITRNSKASIIVEIGTSDGKGTCLLSINAPKSKIYTINIPPDDITKGEGGVFVTHAITIKEIGKFYKQKGLENIEQLYVNTANWEPSMKPIDIAFIDGCHDKTFVINDTTKVIQNMKQGSFIIWHDFNPNLIEKYPWIKDVYSGIETLYEKGVLKNRIYHLKDSWCGIYRL